MKIPEKTGMWVDMSRSTDNDAEIMMQVPDGIWAGWMKSIQLKDDDLATFLRTIGWHVDIPKSAGRT